MKNSIDKPFVISDIDMKPYISEIIRFVEAKGINLKPYPKLVFSKSDEYANNVFGKTAYYEPGNKIVLYTEKRHPKDILRSFTHELIHHAQFVDGKLKLENGSNDPNYAQNDKFLRKLEADAYLRGNMLFRDWTDNYKK